MPFCNCSTLLAKESLIYSYGRSFNGFAAKLTDGEVAKFSGEIVKQEARNEILLAYSVLKASEKMCRRNGGCYFGDSKP